MRALATVLVCAAAGACGGASSTAPYPATESARTPAGCGTAVVHDDAGLAALGDCEVVVGDLLISGEGLSQLRVISLDRLRAVDGDLVIEDNPELVGVRLAALERVGGRLEVSNDRVLAAFGAPRLAAVGASLTIDDTRALIDVDLAALASVGGDVIVSGSRQLAALRLPALTAVGGALRIDDNEGLAELALPQLAAVGGGVVIELNPALPAPPVEELVRRLGASDAVVEDSAPAP